jgi:mono/diheme cytochrome c family protein
MACERCHGAAQEGMVGPSLVNSLKVLTPTEFKTTVLHGRPAKGMPNFDGSKQVVDNVDNLYAYLKGRSDGAINPGRLEEIDK